MRLVVLDTETTGLEPSDGHRVIEIGAVEMNDRRMTGRHYHEYLNPDRRIDRGAQEVHGISSEFLADKPRFKDIAPGFLEFIDGAELIIHNAPFDVGFLDHELKLLGEGSPRIADCASVTDTLELARRMHPGMKNSLDALCRRYDVDNSHRSLHGALLDAQILAEVYLRMTGGQTALSLDISSSDQPQIEANRKRSNRPRPMVFAASEAEMSAHQAILDMIDGAAAEGCIWLRSETTVND
jgi:DNA polymerase-3 subunit epsilon